jgi:hypothetical protein
VRAIDKAFFFYSVTFTKRFPCVPIFNVLKELSVAITKPHFEGKLQCETRCMTGDAECTVLLAAEQLQLQYCGLQYIPCQKSRTEIVSDRGILATAKSDSRWI